MDGNAVRQKCDEYFDELMNVEDDAQASIVAVSGDRRMPVFNRLSDGWVEIYEMKEELSEMICGKAPGLDQYPVKFLKKGGRSMVDWLVPLFNYFFETGRVPRDW